MFDVSAFQPYARLTPLAASDAWIKAVGRMQVETVAFLTRRMIANLELPQALARCSTPAEAMAEQVRYWQVAQRQYMQSLERVTLAAASVPAAAGLPVERSRDYIVVSDNPNPLPAKREAAVREQKREAVEAGEQPLYKKSA